jgi:hypothetical protein
MANYEALKASVDKNGEVMIQVEFKLIPARKLNYIDTMLGLKIVQKR